MNVREQVESAIAEMKTDDGRYFSYCGPRDQ